LSRLFRRFRLCALPPFSPRLRPRLSASPFPWRPTDSFALDQFEFNEAVPTIAVSIIDRFDPGAVPFEIDILHGNSRFRHYVSPYIGRCCNWRPHAGQALTSSASSSTDLYRCCCALTSMWNLA
jgi:hypothetical protein